ncbi:MAG TPA: hypothetical protein VF952_06770 [Chloroflexia bacterium]
MTGAHFAPAGKVINRPRCTDTVDEITGHRSTNVEADWQQTEDYLRTTYRSLAAVL